MREVLGSIPRAALLHSPLLHFCPVALSSHGFPSHSQWFSIALSLALSLLLGLSDSRWGSSVKIGRQRRLAWPLRKDDMHTSRSVTKVFLLAFRSCPRVLRLLGLPSRIIRQNWDVTEKICTAPAQGRHPQIEKCNHFFRSWGLHARSGVCQSLESSVQTGVSWPGSPCVAGELSIGAFDAALWLQASLSLSVSVCVWLVGTHGSYRHTQTLITP